jgi:type II secretory pathway predicted ATPase ExeA/outer membrane protein OmpA-like peptidoglycan-associated protein
VGHFGLQENPFGVTPDPSFLFLSETHREALASLINGISCEFGFQLLLAQPGMGKTTLLFTFLERFRTAAYTAFLFQPLFEPRELLQAVLSELGNGSEQSSMGKLSEQLNSVLGRAAQERKRVIVVVDEAQNLDFSVLEALRQLSNFETARKKLMQIVLSGQPHLAKKLGAPEQEQLLQRISSIGRLSPLGLNETRAYIDHRLKTAGYRGSDLFTPGAMWNVWDHSKGVPRNINTLCFNAMLVAFAEHARSIDERILQLASRDLDLKSALADLYQMDASAAVSGGDGKVQPIRETKPPETDTGGKRPLEKPIEVSGGVGRAPGWTATDSPRNDESTKGTVDSLPPALVEAITRISQTLEEQKIILLSKSAGPAGALSATAFEAPARSSQASSSQPSAPVKSSNKAAGPGDGTSTPEKKSPSTATKEKAAAPPDRGPVTNLTSRQPNPAPAESSSSPGVPVTSRQPPAATKRPERGGPWLKVFSFLAISSTLAVVLVEKFPLRRAGEVEASESVVSVSGQGDSATPLLPRDSSSPSPKNGAADARGLRNARSSESDDVTVRKFPLDSEVARAVSSDAPASPYSIFFDLNSAVIAWQYRAALQQIADALAANPETNVILEGHTDSSGEEAYNLDLSSRRAIAVRDALVNGLNVSGARLSTIGAGSSAPVRPNSTAEGRAYNRRVEVRLVPPSGT